MFVFNMAWKHVDRSDTFAKVVQQHRKADAHVRPQPHRLFQAHQHVPAGVDFRMVFRALRHPEQCVDFREQP